jgi:murein DD-endopeptidase MepM/ murein hydrolase activator NlpD
MKRWTVLTVVFLASCSSSAAPPVPTTAPTTEPVATSVVTEQVATTRTTFDRTAHTPLERCLERAVFGDPSDSPYVLPFPAGTGYTVIQSYCNDDGSHETQLAYDFAAPVGSEVIAARSGYVSAVVSDISDTANTSKLNYVIIHHDDGTVAFYAHLMQNGVLVEIGDTVEQGHLFAYSGSSGRTGEVIHFGVYGTDPPRDEADRAINFSNADGLLDLRGGLRQGTFYTALP